LKLVSNLVGPEKGNPVAVVHRKAVEKLLRSCRNSTVQSSRENLGTVAHLSVDRILDASPLQLTINLEAHALEPDFAERRVKRQLRKILLASADVARRVEGIVFIVENQDAVL
jgi:hypothetical protein